MPVLWPQAEPEKEGSTPKRKSAKMTWRSFTSGQCIRETSPRQEVAGQFSDYPTNRDLAKQCGGDSAEKSILSPVTNCNRAFCCVPLAPSKNDGRGFLHASVHFLLVVLRWRREKQSERIAAIPLLASLATPPCTWHLVFPSLRRQFLEDSICSKDEPNL